MADKWLAKVHALSGVLPGWFAGLRPLADDFLRYRAGSPLYQLSYVPLACTSLCDYQEEVKDDAPSFSFFQNSVSKEQATTMRRMKLSLEKPAHLLANG